LSHPLDPYPAQRGRADGEQIYDAIIRGASDAIMAMDRHGAIVVWNLGCEQLFGWTSQEMVGRSVAELVPESRRHELARVLRALDGMPEPAALETERLHRSGAVLPISCRVSPVLDAQGGILGASAIVRDNSREIELRRQLDEARRLAEARFAQSVVGQVTLTPDGVILDVNRALCALSGYERRDLLGRRVTDFTADDDLEATTAELALLVNGALSDVQRPRVLRRADGRLVETEVGAFPVRDEVSGEVVRIEASVEDVSAAAAAQRELQVREAQWRSMALHSSDVALFCDAEARLLFVSSSVTSVFGYRVEQLLGGDGWSFVHPEDVARVREIWDAVLAGPTGSSETFDVRVLHADGTWHWAEASLTNHLADAAVEAMIVNLLDVSERKAAEAVLDALVGTDSLTGLPTRAPLMAVLDAAFAADLASSTGVAVVDVVRMKLVNDTYGHRRGDQLLREVAARLRAAVGPDVVVGRLAEDRFGVLLTGLTDVAEVFEVCASVVAAMEAPIRLEEHALQVDVTVGAALGPAVEGGALLAAAESALRTAKEGLTGPMHVVRAESGSEEVCRARLVEDLRRGLLSDELVVHFQPVLSLADGRPVAAEALVRWAHPEKGLLGPGAFIDAAEQSGLIVQLGEKVLRDACGAAARWAGDAAEPSFHVAVNLSARQLTGGSVVDVVRRALTDAGASPASLMLEVTESAVMSDVDAAVTTLQELRALGIGIAIDDFGTGYSSLTYLKRFPVTALKIDRSFVHGLGSNGDDAAIVTSVIDLADALRLDCIAEGVETEQQRLVLQSLGCRHGQGFLWSPALDPEAFERWAATTAPTRRPLRSAALGQDASRRAVRRRPLPAPDPAALARAADLREQGASLATIAAALNAEQHSTPHGRRWTARSVAQLLAAR
jgi:PAS domain S-box-containing protein/diguanylate cyclase (GGDEF)-like protein